MDKSTTIKDKNGRLLTEVHDVQNRWAEYCSELYNHDTKPDSTVLTSLWSNQQQEPTPDISISEVVAAVKKLKPRKAPGIDGICGELIQYGGKAALNSLHTICQRA